MAPPCRRRIGPPRKQRPLRSCRRRGRLRQFLAAPVLRRVHAARTDQAKPCAGARYSTRPAVGTGLALGIPRGDHAMFENVFGIHETALLLHGQRLGVLATNLANADTPGYKARDIDFSAVLSQTQGETALPLQVTHAAHITFDDSELPPGELKYRNPYQASLDGNTVEMPVEQAAFSENNVRYQASLNFINLKISELQLAIAGQ
jgi:flagellar basal-body rod protein FlgB